MSSESIKVLVPAPVHAPPAALAAGHAAAWLLHHIARAADALCAQLSRRGCASRRPNRRAGAW